MVAFYQVHGFDAAYPLQHGLGIRPAAATGIENHHFIEMPRTVCQTFQDDRHTDGLACRVVVSRYLIVVCETAHFGYSRHLSQMLGETPYLRMRLRLRWPHPAGPAERSKTRRFEVGETRRQSNVFWKAREVA